MKKKREYLTLNGLFKLFLSFCLVLTSSTTLASRPFEAGTDSSWTESPHYEMEFYQTNLKEKIEKYMSVEGATNLFAARDENAQVSQKSSNKTNADLLKLVSRGLREATPKEEAENDELGSERKQLAFTPSDSGEESLIIYKNFFTSQVKDAARVQYQILSTAFRYAYPQQSVSTRHRHASFAFHSLASVDPMTMTAMLMLYRAKSRLVMMLSRLNDSNLASVAEDVDLSDFYQAMVKQNNETKMKNSDSENPMTESLIADVLAVEVDFLSQPIDEKFFGPPMRGAEASLVANRNFLRKFGSDILSVGQTPNLEQAIEVGDTILTHLLVKYSNQDQTSELSRMAMAVRENYGVESFGQEADFEFVVLRTRLKDGREIFSYCRSIDLGKQNGCDQAIGDANGYTAEEMRTLKKHSTQDSALGALFWSTALFSVVAMLGTAAAGLLFAGSTVAGVIANANLYLAKEGLLRFLGGVALLGAAGGSLLLADYQFDLSSKMASLKQTYGDNFESLTVIPAVNLGVVTDLEKRLIEARKKVKKQSKMQRSMSIRYR